jgi:hypothetical protein
MCKLFSFQTWFVLSLIWTASVFYAAYLGWPQLPLDSGSDAETQSLLGSAMLGHALCYGVLAAGPPLAALLLGRFLCARKA